MPQLVAFGAGNVGRGFIGQIFSDSGWDVTFLDVAPQVVDALHTDGSYIHETVSTNGTVPRTITRVDAAYSSDQDAVDALITRADLVTTSVGARVLPLIAPALAHGLAARWEAGHGPLDILLCENLHGASRVVRDLLLEHIPTEYRDHLLTHCGLAETSIGRMIPAVPPKLQRTPTLVRAEPYCQLPYDATALKAPRPTVRGLVGIDDVAFDFYADRKLFVHNMGHCLCAYVGEIYGHEFIWQAIADPRIHSLVRSAMNQSALALARHYGADYSALTEHIDDLLARFANRALGDPCERVGRDPERKLGSHDRLVGAYRLAQSQGVARSYLSLALAVGIARLSQEPGWDLPRARSFVESALWSSESSNSGDEDERALMNVQIDQAAAGFDWAEQMRLLNEYIVKKGLI
ncbi:mannitol-1-phosphate 5-dehydrogenase [Schaalia sp. ZJ1691]|uniref:mannitol dehydrogenase family protein n=1 Tax=Schaalia sp. ZJ1691 TaxID=2709404 RepID=UPI0013EAD453|nr:mannitol-1-phosphate 5-dehydrogenase [Schaalia sp. ZJ1691]